jgi:uncharacterized repeat protein (TIGR03843 family)
MAPTTSTRTAAGIDRTHPSGTRAPVPEERRWPTGSPLTTSEALATLEQAPIGLVGRLVDASNATFYCELVGEDGPRPTVHAVYKPIEGERPLDDFPDGTLAFREVAAWHFSEASGLGVVPPTVLRDGPFGPGMLQLWIEVDGQEDPLTLVLTRDPRLRRISLLDLVLNNADRKGGHLLPTADGTVLGCDHGICFAAEPKLRTVLWGWSGEPFDDDERRALAAIGTALDGDLGERLESLLSPSEVDATRHRLDALMGLDRFPAPDRGRRVIPWPPF